ncbi:MAG: AMP-binding protein, partial [Treponema sp.]|nr:AMP-binding protein [Treponema sp.]
CWYFLVSLTALLQCKKEVLLTANISPAYIAEIRQSGTAFLTDRNLGAAEASGDILFLPSLLSGRSAAGLSAVPPPPINAGETAILMYTSGTTGRPKAVRQRLTEFETDNAFILSKWGEEWLGRRVCSTVSQHHIYGILYTILLPFTAAVPFRRSRVEFPEEFEKLDDVSYMIITVPAFLKRAVEAKSAEVSAAAFAAVSTEVSAGGGAEPAAETRYALKDPWIYTSGGVLTPDVAEKTNRVFGFWPLEVYGSTETSGIAWRQSKDGLEWTPFDNAELRLNDEGRLVVRSPYIKDPAGFTTGDLADMSGDGRFLLRGRADSIVKIEEKRISLPEAEARILQSGLVSDVCVLALTGRRQYLAAVLALNDRGKERFRGLDKFEINRWFREYLLQFFESVVLPKKWRYLDAQGKKKKLEMEALFAREDGKEDPDSEEASAGPSGIIASRRITPENILEKTEDGALLEFTILPESDYFDNHFPLFKVLPAVAQFELAIRYADRCFKTGLNVKRAKRLKFSAIVRPGTLLRLRLNRDGGSGIVSFVFASPDGETVYSSGSFATGAE